MLNDLWAELANGLNAMRGPTRTLNKWKETVGRWKNQLRCRARKQEADIMATGGGPAGLGLSDFESQALATFAAIAVDGNTDVEQLGFGNDDTLQKNIDSLLENSSPEVSSREATPDCSSPVAKRRKRSYSPLISALMESINKREQREEERAAQEAERAKKAAEKAAETTTALQLMANAIASLAEYIKDIKK